MRKKYCYVTLVTNDKYIEGANLLDQYLKYYKSNYYLLVMIDKSINPSKLTARTRIIPDLHFTNNNTEYLKKFLCLNFIDYEKIIFLDADLIPMENFDYLFDLCEGNSISYEVNAREIANNNLYPHGGIIYFEPNPQLLQDIIKKDKEYFFTDDEDLLYRYFDHVKKFKTSPCYCHMGGSLKYWESKNFKKDKIFNIQWLLKFLKEFNIKRE